MAKAKLSLTLLAIVFLLSACGPRPEEPRVAFSSDPDGDKEVYATNTDGSGQINLTSDPSADWSPACWPGGAGIALASARDGNLEIHVMRVDDSEVTRLTEEAGDDADPSWCSREAKRRCPCFSTRLNSGASETGQLPLRVRVGEFRQPGNCPRIGMRARNSRTQQPHLSRPPRRPQARQPLVAIPLYHAEYLPREEC
jgi:hypothetical protein